MIFSRSFWFKFSCVVFCSVFLLILFVFSGCIHCDFIPLEFRLKKLVNLSHSKWISNGWRICLMPLFKILLPLVNVKRKCEAPMVITHSVFNVFFFCVCEITFAFSILQNQPTIECYSLAYLVCAVY